MGIDVGKLWKGFPRSITHLAGELCQRLGAPRLFHPVQVPLVEGTYVGEAFAVPSQAGAAALVRLAYCQTYRQRA
jgi:hypothetical protein